MIVKDEATVIERCLTSVRPFIDYWVIVDTGSTDDTAARIKAAMQGLPGELHHRPWKNFGHNRSEALALARDKADYLFFIDADEQLGALPGAAFRSLVAPAYSMETRYGELSYDRVNLVSTALPWRWVGVLHEFLDAGEPVAQPRLPGLWIQVTPDWARSSDPLKFEKDAAVLEAALREEPDNARYVFYLAQSWRDAGHLQAALQQYDRRAEMGGWDEEAWYARLQAARMADLLGSPHNEVITRYLDAHEARPSRAEPLLLLATYLRAREQWNSAYLFACAASAMALPPDRLFVDLEVYRWRAQDERALAAFYTRRYAEAEKIWTGLLATDALPPFERPRVEKNLQFLP